MGTGVHYRCSRPTPGLRYARRSSIDLTPAVVGATSIVDKHLGSDTLARITSNMPDLDRITLNPAVMGGKPCIRGLRVTVGMIVGHIAAGRSVDNLLTDFPYLEREDIAQALRYAAWRAEEREVVLPDA